MSCRPLRLGISPCPNDTFIFGPWIRGMLFDAPAVEVEFHDVQQLNRLAHEGVLDLSKISFGAWPALQEEWELLDCGGALGRGCGPLLLRSPHYRGEEKLCWLPGEETTAARLYSWWSRLRGRETLVAYDRFDQIYSRLVSGEIGLGVAIHEGRFTYAVDGLELLTDLGEEWELESGAPIPLGGIVARRKLLRECPGLQKELEQTIRSSIQAAYARREELIPWIIELAGIPDRAVVESHIATYVNSFSEHLGEEGVEAIRLFTQKCRF